MKERAPRIRAENQRKEERKVEKQAEIKGAKMCWGEMHGEIEEKKGEKRPRKTPSDKKKKVVGRDAEPRTL